MSRSMFYRETAIPAAGTTATDPVIIGDAAMLEILGIFDYGSGGTTAKYYVQTSLDGGTSWFDIACLAFTTSDVTRALTVSAGGYDGTALTDGSLADNTVLNGLIGDMLRVKQVIAGTYTASDITIYVLSKAESEAARVSGSVTAVTTIADGADVALGATGDASSANTVIGRLKNLLSRIPAALGQTTMAGSLPVVVASDQSAINVNARGGSTSGITGVSIGSTLALLDSGGTGRMLGALGYAINGTSVGDALRTPKTFTTVDQGAATAETTIWTPTSGKKFRLMGMVLTASAQSKLTFKDNTGGTTIFILEIGANAPIVLNFGNGIISTTNNYVLTVTRGTSCTLAGTLWGTEE